MIATASRYFKYIFPQVDSGRTKEIFDVNPIAATRDEPEHIHVQIFTYNAETITYSEFENQAETLIKFTGSNHICWINIDGIRKDAVNQICHDFSIHALIAEDIISSGQRPKLDETEGVMYFLLNMLYYDRETNTIEPEQVSIVLGKSFLLSFQEEAARDVFNGVRERLKTGGRLRSSGADYLCYALIDTIVDNYYYVLESLSDNIENIEEQILRLGNNSALGKLVSLRKELIVLKRNIAPVRDMVSAVLRSDNELLNERTIKYFKDVSDHITQAYELVENYRDMMMNLHDLYLSKVNLRMNEVMKVMAIVTCLLAPAAVIGGIFGMNFDKIPWLHNRYGFYIAVALMFLIPLGMMFVFRKRKWF